MWLCKNWLLALKNKDLMQMLKRKSWLQKLKNKDLMQMLKRKSWLQKLKNKDLMQMPKRKSFLFRLKSNWLIQVLFGKSCSLMQMQKRKNYLWKKKRLLCYFRHLKPKRSNSISRCRVRSKSKVPRTTINLQPLKPQSSQSEERVCMVTIIELTLNGQRWTIWGKWWKTWPLRLLTSDTKKVLILNIVTYLEPSK